MNSTTPMKVINDEYNGPHLSPKASTAPATFKGQL